MAQVSPDISATGVRLSSETPNDQQLNTHTTPHLRLPDDVDTAVNDLFLTSKLLKAHATPLSEFETFGNRWSRTSATSSSLPLDLPMTF